MSTLDFQDREPELNHARRAGAQSFAGNTALYERLQGRSRKSAMGRYGWIALPVGAVAIVAIVAATSTPHQTANDVVGAPAQTVAASTAAAPKVITPPTGNEALATNDSAQTPEEAALSGRLTGKPATSDQAPADKALSTATADNASVAAKTPASKPAPVKVARRAATPAPDTAVTHPAAAAPAERSAPAPDVSATPPAAPAPSVQAPTVQTPAVQAPAATAAPSATQDAAPQPSVTPAPAPSSDNSAASASPSPSAPAGTTPAQ
jgi:uncharacterized protein YbjQ (UPF0145 family)